MIGVGLIMKIMFLKKTVHNTVKACAKEAGRVIFLREMASATSHKNNNSRSCENASRSCLRKYNCLRNDN